MLIYIQNIYLISGRFCNGQFQFKTKILEPIELFNSIQLEDKLFNRVIQLLILIGNSYFSLISYVRAVMKVMDSLSGITIILNKNYKIICLFLFLLETVEIIECVKRE